MQNVVPIADIKIGVRYRQRLGDISALVEPDSTGADLVDELSVGLDQAIKVVR